TVAFESRIASRAAALSFSSLLGLGPLIAITVLVAGFTLGKNDSNLVADTLNRMIKVVAPQIAQYEQLTQTANEVNPQLVDVINNIITASRSSSAGALGIFSLLLIVLLLFKSIEDSFNDIWGVRQGRSMLMRIVLYWTILTLGAILFFTAVALLGAGTFMSVFVEKLPGGAGNLKSLGWLIQLFSFSLLTLMLMIFYRVIPNTHVVWRAAFVGALVVSTLLLGNNVVAFLYVKRVVLEKSLYGSLAIVPVLMLGLYIFWLYVLIGGTVCYALQNVHYRNSQAAWSTLTESMRERLALVVFLTICRRFRDCLPPISASDLSTMLKVPTQLLNECLNRLVLLELITTLRPAPNSTTTDSLYQPARPLNRITLFDFKTLDDNLGEDPIGSSLERIDPLVGQYDEALNALGDQAFFKKTVDQLCEENPFDESRPPFAMGERRAVK
ncbi:MAG: YihY/virulence factor BrkB family protein, partial [Opitutus sp.]|nr:YihY/virulence factor BrkB family protein [Opitutus sp.]